MIILNDTQADAIRGITSPGNALEPVALLSGEFVLPEAVLRDPAHAVYRDTLVVLPTRAVAAEEFPHED